MTSLKETWHRQRQHRQQEIRHRQQQVHSKLSQFSQERQMQADELRQVLKTFSRSLSEEVADFLAQTTDDRLSDAEALWQSLDEFHHNLEATVAVLRQQLQYEIETIQAETHEFLETSEQTRWQNQIQLQQKLTAELAELRDQVAIYLSDLETMRHDRADQLQQMLQQNRQQRQAEMEQLHSQFAVLRSERAAFCVQLRQTVWGTPALAVPSPAAIVPLAAVTPIAVTGRLTKTRSAASAGKKQATQNGSPAPVRTASRTAHMTTTTPTIPRTPAATPQSKLNPLEQTIFDHLRQVHKATLTEIQAKFGINRFAAVDVLRALIKKGCITQRDRFYLA